MEKQEDIRFLKEQLAFFAEREKVLIKQLQDQSIQLHSQSIQINELIASIRSLEATLGSRQQDIQLLQGKNRGLGKLLGSKSEKIAVSSPKARK